MLREELDDQNDLKGQVDTKTNTPKTRLNDNYCLVENPNQLQKVLDETSLSKALASTQEVNNAIKRI